MGCGSCGTDLTLYQAAKRYVGRPFAWGGRNPQHGMDCLGLILRAAADCGLSLPAEIPKYRRLADRATLLGWLDQNAERLDAIEQDAVLVIAVRNNPQHLAIAGIEGYWRLVHARAELNQIVCESYDHNLMRNTHSIWRVKWQH